MNYCIYKFHFKTAVHIGNERITDGEYTVHADTFFSALCCEAAQMHGAEGVEQLAEAAKGDRVIISDLLPFIDENYYIPKPLCPVKTEQTGDSVKKKLFKKLKYIPLQQLENYLAGGLDPEKEAEQFKRLGKFELRTFTSAREEGRILHREILSYQVGVYQFAQSSGLYLIFGYEDEEVKDRFEALLHSLSYSGIGGKRSAGLGKFEIEEKAIPAAAKEKLGQGKGRAILLSAAMAKPAELEQALQNAGYLLVKRSGFVYSENYADTLQRKKDLYLFNAGSFFENRFEGDVFDISEDGKHPVYRYAKPLFLEV